MKYKKYSKYKDSGVEWIGEIPEGWDTSRIKFYFNIKTGKTLQSKKKHEDDVQVPYITAGNVLWEKVVMSDLETMWVKSKEVKKYEVKNQNLLVCEGGEAGRSALANEIKNLCITQNHVHVVSPKKDFSTGFLLYTLEAIKDSGWFETITKRVAIPTLPNLVLGNTKIPIPSPDIQNQIIAFLKKETTQFDELIAKSKAQVTLIEEKRQATITQAVTKGLDPSVPMKDSGVEWIGEVPEGWEIKRLKFLIKNITKGTTPSTLGKSFVDVGVRFLKVENISKNGLIDISNCSFIDNETNELLKRSKLKENNILVSIAGAIGRSALVSKEILPANTNQAVAIISLNINTVSPNWVVYCFNSSYLDSFFENNQVMSAQANLSLEDLGNIPLVIPTTKEEEIQISEFLDKQTSQFDELIAKSKEQITILEEKRQALITTAVTGKIDVRSEVVA